jgi:UDP-3-O-[3-hydroxymyristoyl] N-acetylglucosamine deacetylase
MVKISRSQATIKKEVVFEGIGVHSGKNSLIRLLPSDVNSGIIFKNADYPKDPILIGSVIPESVMYSTIIKNACWGVSTVEHLMAAIFGLEISNLVVEVEGQEVPILDGSAFQFSQEILRVGIKIEDAGRTFLTPKNVLKFCLEEDRMVEVFPAAVQNNGQLSKTLNVEFYTDFSHPLVSKGFFKGEITKELFVEKIAPARTFGFLEQLSVLRKHNLANGTSLGNTVVIGNDGYINKPRFENEFTCHKLLDLIGDISLLPHAIIGTIVAKKSGHILNRLVIEHFIKNKDQWDFV